MEEENRKELDEKSMIVEQARLEKEKKRRKNRRKKRIVLAVLLVVAAGGIWYFFWGRKPGADRENTVKIEKSAGQEIVYVRLDSVKGNEITYTTAEARQQKSGAADGGNGVQSTQGNMPQEQGIRSGASENQSEPGGMPEAQEATGKDGVTEGRSNTGGAVASQGGSGFTYDGVTYGLTGETGTTLIPVGTAVITRLGTETTFSRLQAGAYVALVMEGNGEGSGDDREIVSVYILG